VAFLIKSIKAREISLVIAFAALYIVFSVFKAAIPLRIPVVGAGTSISLTVVLGPVFGLILGPFLGALAAFLGAFVSWMTPPGAMHYFGLFTTVCPATAAFVAGSLSRKNLMLASNTHFLKSIRGWMVAAFTLSILTLLWYATWVGQAAPMYPVLQFAGLAVILMFRGRLADLFKSASKVEITVAVGLLNYCGLVADHMLGNLIFIGGIGWVIPLKAVERTLKSLGLPDIASLFMYMIPISLAERIAMSLISTIIAVSLIIALRASKLMQIP
jgi:hypothetical protein